MRRRREPIRIFYSYAHEDEDFRNGLEVQLASLQRQGLIKSWHDRRIGAGKEFEREIDAAIERADIILLLVSRYFIASDYCYGRELKIALRRHRSGEARTIPVILRPSDWTSLPFGKLTATPTDGKPVSKFRSRDDGFLEVGNAIRQAVHELLGIDDEIPAVRPSTRKPSAEKETIIESSDWVRVTIVEGPAQQVAKVVEEMTGKGKRSSASKGGRRVAASAVARKRHRR